MGSGEAKVANFLITGGASALSDKFQIFDEGGRKKKKKTTTPDARKTRKEDVSKQGARAALTAGGSSEGILTSAATSGRGTLLGN